MRSTLTHEEHLAKNWTLGDVRSGKLLNSEEQALENEELEDAKFRAAAKIPHLVKEVERFGLDDEKARLHKAQTELDKSFSSAMAGDTKTREAAIAAKMRREGH
jgi:hypothetical protein